MVAGTKSVAGVTGGLTMGWWHPPQNGAIVNEVEMVEEEHRGDREEED
jgi:hypothetical protein